MTMELRRDIFEAVLLTQEVEATFAALYRDGDIGVTTPAGDARVAMVAAAKALQPSDRLFGTRRDLPAAIGRGASLESVFCQALGVEGDPSMGRGMPGTLNDAEIGVALTDGGAAAHLVHAAGFGHAAKLNGADTVALGLFGSAAQANGDLHAALNFAAVNRAHVVYVARGPLAGELRLDDVASAWGVNALRVDGDDGLAVCQAVAEARERAITGEGPTVIDARLENPLRPVDAQALQAARALSGEDESDLKHAIFERVSGALLAARQAPPISVHTLFNDTYSDRPWFL